MLYCGIKGGKVHTYSADCPCIAINIVCPINSYFQLKWLVTTVYAHTFLKLLCTPRVNFRCLTFIRLIIVDIKWLPVFLQTARKLYGSQSIVKLSLKSYHKLKIIVSCYSPPRVTWNARCVTVLNRIIPWDRSLAVYYGEIVQIKDFECQAFTLSWLNPLESQIICNRSSFIILSRTLGTVFAAC